MDTLSLENQEILRPVWSKHIEFLISAIGGAVGLGNVWRFPFLVYSNGGGVFLIPYTISLFIMGIPLLNLEMLLGQFASLGPVAVWEINPLFKGLGISLTLVSMFIAIFYNVVIAMSAYFLFASMNLVLPWTTCGNRWNTCVCRTNEMNLTLSDPEMWYDMNGLNCTGIELTEMDRRSSSEEYFNNEVLQKTEGIYDAGVLKWDMTLCNLLVWVGICASIIKGVRSIGKVNYIVGVCPYILLSILVVRGLTLPGSGEGISYYLTPNATRLGDPKVWTTAASQIMFSISAGMGVMLTFSSYNKFTANILVDGMIISIVNCLTSFYAGFAIFSVLGYMADISNVDIGDVTASGPGLVFVVYPEALGTMPAPQLWSVLFFSMLVFLGFGSQYSFVETVLTSIQDGFPKLRRPYENVILRVGLCTLLFLLGLPQTTQGGFYVLEMSNRFLDFPLLFLGLLEFLVLVWIYGIGRIQEDIFIMVGSTERNSRLFTYYYKWTLQFAGPLLLIFIILFQLVGYKPITNQYYPPWAEALGWMEVTFVMMWVPVWFVYKYYKEACTDVLSWSMCKSLNQPTVKWGPADPMYRTIPRYREYLMQLPSNDAEPAGDGNEEDDEPSEHLDKATIDGDTETVTDTQSRRPSV